MAPRHREARGFKSQDKFHLRVYMDIYTVRCTFLTGFFGDHQFDHLSFDEIHIIVNENLV